MVDILTRHVHGDVARGDGTGPAGDGRTLTGLAVPYRTITRIDNWFEGTFDEQFALGAFKRSLGMKTPKLQFDHGTHPMLGSIPLGTFRSLVETRRGLEVEAELFDNWLVKPVADALATDAIDGMSIRFRPVRVEVTEPDARTDGGDVELRTIVEAELHELGPVVFPAYDSTEVDLRTLDLADENDRHRLALALLGGGATTDRVGQPSGPPQRTAPTEAGAPATVTGPADSHPETSRPRRSMQARKDFYDRWMCKS